MLVTPAPTKAAYTAVLSWPHLVYYSILIDLSNTLALAQAGPESSHWLAWLAGWNRRRPPQSSSESFCVFMMVLLVWTIRVSILYVGRPYSQFLGISLKSRVSDQFRILPPDFFVTFLHTLPVTFIFKVFSEIRNSCPLVQKRYPFFDWPFSVILIEVNWAISWFGNSYSNLLLTVRFEHYLHFDRNSGVGKATIYFCVTHFTCSWGMLTYSLTTFTSHPET